MTTLDKLLARHTQTDTHLNKYYKNSTLKNNTFSQIQIFIVILINEFSKVIFEAVKLYLFFKLLLYNSFKHNKFRILELITLTLVTADSRAL